MNLFCFFTFICFWIWNVICAFFLSFLFSFRIFLWIMLFASIIICLNNFQGLMHKEVQLSPGVYVTDFRKNETLVGLTEPKNELSNDVGLLLDDILIAESKINKLIQSIEIIKQQENWQEDSDYSLAVQENWQVVIRLSSQMKKKIQKLKELKYHPDTNKIQQMIQIERIEIRQLMAVKEYQKAKSENLKDYEESEEKQKQKNKQAKQQKMLVQVDDQDENGGVYV